MTGIMNNGNSPVSMNNGQEMPDVANVPGERRSYHILNIIIIAVALIFSIGASIWLLIPPSKRTFSHSFSSSHIIPQSNATPTTSLPSLAPAPTIFPPAAVITDLEYLSQELNSGDLSRIAAVSTLNLQKLSTFDKSRLALVKSTTFDPESFRQDVDPKHATVRVTIFYTDGSKDNTVYLLVLKNGHWRIGQN